MACLIQSQGCWLPNPSGKIPELTTSWSLIAWTVQADDLVIDVGFPLRAAINLSSSSVCTLSEHYIVCWPSSTSIWIDSHPVHACSCSCCFWFYVKFINVCPGTCFRLLQLQCHSGLTGVCFAAVFHRVAHRLKRLLFGSIQLQSHLVEVFLESWLVVVEM